MNVKKISEKAKYYEGLTRQYKEAQDFLKALKYKSSDVPFEDASREFGSSNELVIAKPAVFTANNYRSELIYRVNIVKDLHMDSVNAEINEILINGVKNRMQAIEDELAEVFGID